MSFLKAEWRKLAIANYEVSPDCLEPYVPFGTELDIWEGKCYVSLVGFMFVNTKVLGISVPFHRHFEEVNLRFYVKRFDGRSWRRGVVFIKEIVPRWAITLVANTLYREHYQTLPMRHTWEESGTERVVRYSWKKSRAWHDFQIRASIQAKPIAPGSKTEFITEHYWGYAKGGKAKTVEYEVTHPRWEAYDVLDYRIDVDHGAVYGPEWAFLNDIPPSSVMLAEGSEITVENKTLIEHTKPGVV